jgi:hypothetical protein
VHALVRGRAQPLELRGTHHPTTTSLGLTFLCSASSSFTDVRRTSTSPSRLTWYTPKLLVTSTTPLDPLAGPSSTPAEGGMGSKSRRREEQ